MAESDWVIEGGQRVKTIKQGHCTIRICRPILTDEERERAERRVLDALRIFAAHTGIYEEVTPCEGAKS